MPIGSLHKDSETSVKLKKVEVYETYEHEHLESLLKDIPKLEVTNIVVFFSPSGVKSAVRYLNSSSDKKIQVCIVIP